MASELIDCGLGGFCMETRSRKRAEASSAAPSSPSSGPTTRSSKRARLSSSSSASAAATTTASISSVNTRSRASRTKEQPLPPKNPPPMDSANDFLLPYTSKMLLAAIDEQCRGTYDFLYLPIDFKNKCNVGYAFINMIDPGQIIPFHKAFNGKKWEKFNSEKLALNMDGGAEDDDNDSEGGVGILHQHRNDTVSAHTTIPIPDLSLRGGWSEPQCSKYGKGEKQVKVG